MKSKIERSRATWISLSKSCRHQVSAHDSIGSIGSIGKPHASRRLVDNICSFRDYRIEDSDVSLITFLSFVMTSRTCTLHQEGWGRVSLFTFTPSAIPSFSALPPLKNACASLFLKNYDCNSHTTHKVCNIRVGKILIVPSTCTTWYIRAYTSRKSTLWWSAWKE